MLPKRVYLISGIFFIFLGFLFLISSFSGITGLSIFENAEKTTSSIFGIVFIVGGFLVIFIGTKTLEEIANLEVKSFRRWLEKKEHRKIDYKEAKEKYDGAKEKYEKLKAQGKIYESPRGHPLQIIEEIAAKYPPARNYELTEQEKKRLGLTEVSDGGIVIQPTKRFVRSIKGYDLNNINDALRKIGTGIGREKTLTTKEKEIRTSEGGRIVFDYDKTTSTATLGGYNESHDLDKARGYKKR